MCWTNNTPSSLIHTASCLAPHTETPCTSSPPSAPGPLLEPSLGLSTATPYPSTLSPSPASAALGPYCTRGSPPILTCTGMHGARAPSLRVHVGPTAPILTGTRGPPIPRLHKCAGGPPSLPVHVGPALPHLRLLALEDLVGVDDVEEVGGEVEGDGDLLPHAEGQAAGVDAHVLRAGQTRRERGDRRPNAARCGAPGQLPKAGLRGQRRTPRTARLGRGFA